MRIFICGDSSCGNMPDKYRPIYGWGEFLADCLNGIEVINAASGGRSSKSFLEEGSLQMVLDQLEKGDLMLIQFGGNDALWDSEKLYTDPKTTYPEYLMRYVNGAKEKGAIPVLLTSVWLRRYHGDELVDILHEYNDAVRELAERENLLLAEVVGEAIKKMAQLPKEETATYYANLPAGVYENFPNGNEDNNHSLRKGAVFNAQIVADGLRALKLM